MGQMSDAYRLWNRRWEYGEMQHANGGLRDALQSLLNTLDDVNRSRQARHDWTNDPEELRHYADELDRLEAQKNLARAALDETK